MTGRIDDNLAFVPINLAVMTVSDSRRKETDDSGQLLQESILSAGHRLLDRVIVQDDVSAIQEQCRLWIRDPGIDVIVSTGGTGITGRDVTPEAFRSLYDKEIEGFGELFRMLSYQAIGTSTIQSRATAGVAQGTYLFALPGSPGAVRDGWEIIRPQLDRRHRPCNLVQLMPRLMER